MSERLIVRDSHASALCADAVDGEVILTVLSPEWGEAQVSMKPEAARKFAAWVLANVQPIALEAAE